MNTETSQMRVILANPRGFCAGVERAVSIVEKVLQLYGPPVYVRHAIVHNRHVVEALRERGAVFVDSISEIPPGGITIFSAHGVSTAVEDAAQEAGLDIIDATCPLVRKVHIEGRNFAEAGYEVVIIGHKGHAEVEGTTGQIHGPAHVVSSVADVEALVVANPERVAYVTQTTLSILDTGDVIAALKRRFPSIAGPNVGDICYATQNRQSAVLRLAREAPLILVVGSPTSSNASRLREIAEQAGARSYLVEDEAAVDASWLDGLSCIGVTSGASTPDAIVQGVLARLAQLRTTVVEIATGVEEHVHFKMPKRLGGQFVARPLEPLQQQR